MKCRAVSSDYLEAVREAAIAGDVLYQNMVRGKITTLEELRAYNEKVRRWEQIGSNYVWTEEFEIDPITYKTKVLQFRDGVVVIKDS